MTITKTAAADDCRVIRCMYDNRPSRCIIGVERVGRLYADVTQRADRHPSELVVWCPSVRFVVCFGLGPFDSEAAARRYYSFSTAPLWFLYETEAAALADAVATGAAPAAALVDWLRERDDCPQQLAEYLDRLSVAGD